MKITKEEKQVIKISIIIAVIGTIAFFIIGMIIGKIFWGFSFLIGYLISLITFFKNGFFVTISLDVEKGNKWLIVLSVLISIILYIGVLLLNFFIKELNIFVALGGLVVVKIAVISLEIFNIKRGDKN